MPAPPPPPPPTFSAPSAGQDGRGMLLQSIRAGKALKKTVTVDKSAPAISGKVRGEQTASTGSSGPTGIAASIANNNAGPPNLGGLFSGGMPKLKPTGLRSNIVEKDGNATSDVAPQAPPVMPSPSVKRGPPPVPPPATQKPQIFPQVPSIPESSTSNAPEQPTPSKGFGKPSLAPKPPATPLGVSQKPSPPPKKLNLPSGPSVSRAQSMRLPRSPPVLAPTPPSLHQSQDCLNEMQHRPINRILRPPVARPPSPPTSKVAPAPPITRTAPPPPPPPSRLAVTAPSMPPPPPPPPNRSTSMHQRLAPPPPPTPPTRGASAASSLVRNGQSSSATLPTTMTATSMMFNADLEMRFGDKFHSIMNFPNPAPFRGFPKVYNSKNAAKQQAPAPPLQPTSTPGTMLQLNASSGGKQWQHNAASSAC